MGWAIGEDHDRRRFIGYGVPAQCDHPGCAESIDRGLSYACGGGVTGDVENCGLFFCERHLRYVESDDDQWWSCERCAAGDVSFDPSPDVPEWLKHLLADESWSRWRAENPERVEAIRADLSKAEALGGAS